MSADHELVSAIEAQDRKAAAAALAAGASPDAMCDARRMRVLEMAIALRSPPLVKLLVTRGASVTATDDRGRHALHLLAESFPDPALGMLMIDRGAPLDALDRVPFEERAPLHRAVQRRKLDFAEMLLDNGANIDVVDGHDGYTPLHLLCKSENGSMSPSEITAAVWLMRRGADVTRASLRRVTPLHLAAGSGSVAVVNALLARGATVTRDAWGQTPLYYCLSTHKRDPEMWDALIAAGCGVDDRNARGATPLHEAQASWSEHAVRYLLGKGADLAARDAQGRTALERAEALGQQKILKALGLRAVAATTAGTMAG